MPLSASAAKGLAIHIGYDAAGIALPHSAGAPAWAHSVIVGLHATLDPAFDYEMYVEYDSRRKWYKFVYTALETISFRLAEALRAEGHQAQALTYEDSLGQIDFKRAAVEAGLGVLGRNHLVIHRRYGPRVRFGAVFVGADWPADRPLLDYYCPSCTLCWHACPTGALGAGGLDRALCIAEYNPTSAMAALQDKLELHPTPCTRLQCTACITACPIGARLPSQFYRDRKMPIG